MAFLAIVVRVTAQQQAFWVVESNLNKKDFTIVRVYSPNHQLLHEEVLNFKVDISSKKDQRMLNKKVEFAMKRYSAGKRRVTSGSTLG